jgi:CheY-like chemotaxis protein
VASGQRRPILVVEDDEDILHSIGFFLADEGYPVALAVNGKEALERAEERSPCLILLDMNMPVMDGWAFASAYRARPGPHTPIIVLTAAHDSQSRAAEIAADDVISKPFDLDQMLELVRRYTTRG